MTAMADQMQRMGESIIGFIAATQSDEVLREAFADGVLSVARPRFAGLLRAVLGDDSPHIELLVDTISGTLIMRAGIIGNLESPEAWTAEMMALIDALES